MFVRKRKFTGIKIKKTELPNVKVIIDINLECLKDSKNIDEEQDEDTPIYCLHGMTYNQMRKYICNLPEEKIVFIEKIMNNFPEKANIYAQCAFYFRAFSRGQIFYDANHRTGYFSLQNILNRKGIIIKADLDEITGLTEYIKGQGWLKMGKIPVNLKEKDEEYYVLRDWFKERLDLG